MARVGLFVHELNTRTIAEVVRSLARAMEPLVDEVTVLATGLGDRLEEDVDVRLVRLHRIGSRTIGAAASLRRELRHLELDALFAHGNGPMRTAVVATRGAVRRPVLVGVEHNHFSTYPWRNPRLRRLLARAVLPQLDRVIGVSFDVADDLVKVSPVMRSRTVAIPPPLTRWDELAELAAETVDDPWFDGRVPIVVTVGNVHARKDHATLIRAVGRLVAEGRQVRAAIIGRPGPLLPRLEALVRDVGADGRVRFLGFQDHPLRYVARSTVFALTSLNEGMPVSLIEAMAVGVPVVATDCPAGPAWLTGGGRYGALVPMRDDRAVAAAIATILDDGGERDRLVRSGRARVRWFEPRRIAAQHLAVAGIAVRGGRGAG